MVTPPPLWQNNNNMRSPLPRRNFLAGSAAALALLAVPRTRAVPAGFRPLFDGRSLDGWRAIPRLPVARAPGESAPGPDSEAYRVAAAHRGEWRVEDGVILGGQQPAGSGLGAYLITEAKFGDFELLIDANPDWPTDTGVMVRTTPLGAQGYQIHIDYRQEGSIGTFYGNGIGNFRVRHYSFEGELEGRRVRALRPRAVPPTEPAGLAYGCPPDAFFKAWRVGEWNTLRIRCRGAIPTLTTWINDVKIAELDAANLQREGYNRDAVAALLGPRGHIALEVHHHTPNSPERWGHGAYCRWRNLFIRDL